MHPTRKSPQSVEPSAGRQIPAALSPRCPRKACMGAICPGWRQCGPGTAMGGYRSLLKLGPSRVETTAKARRMCA